MTTTSAVVAATRTLAAYAIGQHVADHDLTFERLQIHDRVDVSVMPTQAHRWRTTAVTEVDHTVTTHPAIADAWKHQATLILHGSCVQVQLRWFTYLDHHDCDLCKTGLCACRDLDTLCPGRAPHACTHGMNLCPDCQAHCPDCRNGLTGGGAR